ncbi:MAG: ADP-ribosylglycohydrolase family protein [Chloroflexota bacterium]
MLGAIAGDIIGSRFEWHNASHFDFHLFHPDCRFTDDTVLTLALADSLLSGVPYVQKLKEYYRRYPEAGFGGSFRRWAQSGSLLPYNSYGNGSAMRVSPVGFAYDDLELVLSEAERSAAVTHNHPQGILGAQAIAAAIFWARKGASKDEIRRQVIERFGYRLDDTVAGLHGVYTFDVSCQGSVPQALIAFLESSDYESAIRSAIYIGGDSDTIACMTGGIAQAYYKTLPAGLLDEVLARLDAHLAGVLQAFNRRWPVI